MSTWDLVEIKCPLHGLDLLPLNLTLDGGSDRPPYLEGVYRCPVGCSVTFKTLYVAMRRGEPRDVTPEKPVTKRLIP